MVIPLLVLIAIHRSPELPPLLTGIGHNHREIATTSPMAAKYFDQGLSLFYAFHKSTSTNYFKAAERLDPKCAMAYWGEALSYAPDINVSDVEPDASARALTALKTAKRLATNETEKDLIDAGLIRFADSDYEKRGKLDLAYSNRMRELDKKYSTDPDVACLFAESLLILNPWHQWNRDGSPLPSTSEAIDVLQRALKESPEHLMAIHLWIHTMEGGPLAAEALPEADLLCRLAPSLGHLVHMPSHIYIRVGMWPQAIEQNRLAITADRKFMKEHGSPATYLGYMIHNRMMLAFAAMMSGSYKSAQWALQDFDEQTKKPVPDSVDNFADATWAMKVDVEKRFGHWDKLLAMSSPPEEFSFAIACWHADRAVAFAAKAEPKRAQSELASFLQVAKTVLRTQSIGNNKAGDLIDMYEHSTRGELLVLQGQYDAGLAQLQKAVFIEDQQKYDEPPDWTIPCRHTLGAALLKAARYKEALTTYQEQLTLAPGDGWASLGIANAYAALGDAAKSQMWMAKYKAAWAKDGEPQTSSCACLPQALVSPSKR